MEKESQWDNQLTQIHLENGSLNDVCVCVCVYIYIYIYIYKHLSVIKILMQKCAKLRN